MSYVDIKIETDNAAFEEDSGSHEIARILHKLADQLIREETDYASLMDINGNKVGEYNVTED